VVRRTMMRIHHFFDSDDLPSDACWTVMNHHHF
jgi:hypothetical protein